MSLALIELRANYVTAGNPARGSVTFTPRQWQASSTDNIIYVPNDVPVEVETGTIVIQLATGDDEADPPYIYDVHEKFGRVTRTYSITLPVVAAGSSVDLADLQPDGTWDAADVAGPTGSTGGF